MIKISEYKSTSEIPDIPIPNRSNFKNILNSNYGKLTVVKYGGKINKDQHWWCQCDCEEKNIILISVFRLKNGKKCCGCSVKERPGNQKTHGGSYTEEYKIWRNILARCYNKRNISYRNYGERGITVEERWRNSFSDFIDDVGMRPSKEYSIDRIDNDGNYCKENCRWATSTEQHNNTRRNIYYTYNGKTLTVPQWEREYKINKGTLKSRLTNGWDFEKALTTPISDISVQVFEFDGKKLSMPDWSQELNIPLSALYFRLEHGWSIEDTLATPINSHIRKIEFNGESLTIKEWAQKIGINQKTLKARIDGGNWTLEKALTTPLVVSQSRDRKI